MSETQNQKNGAIVLIALSAILIFVAKTSNEDLRTENSAAKKTTNFRPRFTAAEFDRIVNSHLKRAAAKIRLQDAKNKLEVYYSSKDLSSLDSQQNKSIQLDEPDPMLDRELDMENSNIYKESGHADSEVVALDVSPEELIGHQLAIEQEDAAFLQATQQAYVMEFISNARRAGYAVTLDENLTVTKIERIRDFRSPDSAGNEKGKSYTGSLE